MVLVIPAILAALLIPSLTAYIDKAHTNAVVAQARGIHVAAQAAVAEPYGLNKDFALRATLFADATGARRGRVTNNMLYYVQRGQTPPNQTGIGVDAAFARNVLQSLDSTEYAAAQYPMNSNTNPLSFSVADYEKQKKQPGIIICYTPEGQIDFVEFGSDGILVHMEDGTITTTKNGTFSRYPDT